MRLFLNFVHSWCDESIHCAASGKVGKMKKFFAFFLFTVAVSACGGAIQTSGDIARGRQALFRGDNQTALGYFQTAAQTDPGYSFGTDRSEGVYSYLGRAQYLNGQYAQARQSLQ